MQEPLSNIIMRYPPRAQGQWRNIAPKVGVIKNVIVLGCSFLCAYGVGFTPLRTYIALSDRLKIVGPVVLALTYVTAAISCVYAVPAAKKYRYKYIVAVCYLPFGLLAGASAYTTYYTVLPAAVAIGLVQGPLLSAATAYLINMAAQYAYFSHKTMDGMVLRMFSILNTLYSMGVFMGHLQVAGAFNAIEYTSNKTHLPCPEYVGSQCGRRFCNPSSLKLVPRLDRPQAYNFTAIWSNFAVTAELSHIVPLYSLALGTGLMIVGVLLALFPLGKLNVQLCAESQKSTSLARAIADMVRIVQDKKMYFTIPISLFLGFSEAFLPCDVMKAFVACTTPKSTVGYVLFVAGLCAAFLHSFLSSAVRQLDRLVILMSAAAVQFSSLLIMWMWQPISTDRPMLYVIATSWQMANTIFRVLCQSMLFRAFPEHWEAPFSVFYMAIFSGQALGFGLCPISCFEYKIYFSAVFFSLALVPYAVLEILLQRKNFS